jgi:hypothetical protein
MRSKSQPPPHHLLVYLLVSLCFIFIACSDTPSDGPVVVVENEQGTPLSDSSLSPTATPILPTNLIENGDFQRPWEEGWERYTGEVVNGQSVTEVFATSQADSGQGVRLIHSGESELSISQTIDVPTLDATFQVRINTTAENPCMGILRGCSGLAGLMVSLHEDGANAEESAGELIWINAGRYNEDEHFPSNSTRNFVFIEPGWRTISFNLAETITNRLPDVDADRIEAVTITLVAGTAGRCDPGECRAEVQATDIELVPVSRPSQTGG